MNRQFEIRLAVKSPFNSLKIIHSDEIEGDDMVEVTSKIPLMIARALAILKDYEDRHKVYEDDDIPF
jgi:hypothetical protein